MKLGKFIKEPADVLDYDVDFSEWIPSSDSIATATPTADTGITLGLTTITGNTVKQWVSGGTDGATYKITLTVTTTGGRTKQVEFHIKVKDY